MKSRTRTPAVIAAAALAIFGLPRHNSALCTEGATPATPSGEIPSLLYTDLPSQLDVSIPRWMAADKVIDESGRLTDLVPEHRRATIESFLTAPVPGRCIEVTEFYDNYPALQGETLAEAIGNSELILSGTVTAKAAGFETSEPGQLFRLQLEDVHKGSSSLDYYYFFVPVGRFRAGPYEICKTDARFPAVPEIGDQVVLLVPAVRNPAEHYLSTSREASLIILREADVVLPVAFNGEERDQSPSAFLSWVEQRSGGSRR